MVHASPCIPNTAVTTGRRETSGRVTRVLADASVDGAGIHTVMHAYKHNISRGRTAESDDILTKSRPAGPRLGARAAVARRHAVQPFSWRTAK